MTTEAKEPLSWTVLLTGGSWEHLQLRDPILDLLTGTLSKVPGAAY